jgi:hypothetical protein
MIFQLMQMFYDVPNLSNLLMEHYTILPAVGGADAANGPRLGRDFNFQFSYEHSAAAAAKTNPSYRYVALPDRIDLSRSSNRGSYAKATVSIPDVGDSGSASSISIPAARVAWGLTIAKQSRNPEAAMAFVNLVLGAPGTAALTANGPAPISPALVSTGDYARLPGSTRSLVTAGEVLP